MKKKFVTEAVFYFIIPRLKFGSFLLFFISLLGSKTLVAQCTSTINTFPYSEDFETSQGGWTSGGTNNDWAWGTPAKAVITNAGSGNKCWITGTLTGSNYQLGERSYIKSPCFDFTNLANPQIVFRIFWESEQTYDGTNLQYSTDNEFTWNNVGSYYDKTDCLTQNWYNTETISNLSGLASTREGWTGNIQNTSGGCKGGNGSNGWKIASHCVANLAGKSNVIFRFTFGAGTSCNAFDGIAIDAFEIKNADTMTTDFTYTCNLNTVSFTNNSTQCPNTFLWNFGDKNNTSTQENPTYTFSGGGKYTVTLKATNSCGVSNTTSKEISIIEIHPTIQKPSCVGASDGAIFLAPPSGNSYTYLWNTNAADTLDSLTNILAGKYIVTVSATGLCGVVDTITLLNPDSIKYTALIKPSTCEKNNGKIVLTTNGGTPPYNYIWSDKTGNGNSIETVFSGSYIVTITDAKNCTEIDTLKVTDICNPELFFPTGFSPNKDGINDVFHPLYSEALSYYELSIYNRWGELIYSSKNPQEGWDGNYKNEAAPSGIYTYTVQYKFEKSTLKFDRGNITLVR